MLYFGFIDLEKTSALSCHFNKQQDMLLRNYEHFLQNYPKWLQYCTRQCSAAKVSCVKVNKIFHHLSTPRDNDIMSESFLSVSMHPKNGRANIQKVSTLYLHTYYVCTYIYFTNTSILVHCKISELMFGLAKDLKNLLRKSNIPTSLCHALAFGTYVPQQYY